MTQLSLLDQALFKLEKSGMPPMYMGAAMIVDPKDSPFPLDGQILARHLAAFMEEIPLMRQKLVQDKMRLGNMRLVDDPEFDVNQHFLVSQLKAPGGYRELTEHLEQFSRRRMDLDRPLWHYEIIEGLEGGQIAVASHLHHSVLDGVGASRVLGGMISAEPEEPRQPRKGSWSSDPEPGPGTLAGSALLEQARRLYVDTPKFVYANARPILKALNTQLARRLQTTDEAEENNKSNKPKVQKTSLNTGQVSEKRIVAYLNLPMDEIKALRKTYDCSVNDLALFINSVALEHYFKAIGENVDFDLVSTMPINTRAADDQSSGNSMSVAMVNLHNTVADPKERLAAITRDTREIKASSNRPGNKAKSEEPSAKSREPSAISKEPSVDFGALSGLFSPILLDIVAYMISRFALFEKMPPVSNVNITNVPGPTGDIYISGARVVGNIPMAPFGGPLALTITISSSSEDLSIGYHGCGKAIEDKELLVAGAEHAFALLKKNAKPGRKTAKIRAKPKKGRGAK